MLITFEGIEGSGKSTQAKRLKDWLQKKNIPCVLTREPGGTDIGKQIRRVLLDPNHIAMSPLTELLLYMADRAQHLAELILPELALGKLILCDRFFDATTVYQGVARQINMNTIMNLHHIVLADLKPKKTLLFDLPVEQGLARAWKRIHADQSEQNENRFEKESIQFHEQVRKGYLELANKSPDRFIIVDADQPEMHVFENIVSIFDQFILNPSDDP